MTNISPFQWVAVRVEKIPEKFSLTEAPDIRLVRKFKKIFHFTLEVRGSGMIC